MEEGYDEELEKLLGEIPRATSAPPHSEELQAVHQDQSQESNDTLTDETPIIQTLNHHPLLYTPFPESGPMSSPMSTHLYDDPPLPSDPCTSFYSGLPSVGYGLGYLDMSKKQAQHSTDPGCSTSNDNLLLDHIPHLREVNQDAVSTMQHDTQGKVKVSNGLLSSVSSGVQLEAATCLDVKMSAAASAFSASSLPSSLQLLDSFAQNASENGLHNELDKLALTGNRLASENRATQQLAGTRFLHAGWSLLELQAGLEKTMSCAATVQLGSQHSMAYGGSWGSFLPPYPTDLKLVCAQRLHEAAAQQQQIEERVFCRQRIKEEFLLRQQKLQEQQARFYASLHGQPGPTYCRGHPHNHQLPMASCLFDFLQQQPRPKTTLPGGFTPERQGPITGICRTPPTVSGEVPQALGICRYFLQGVCTRGDLCPFSHPLLQTSTSDNQTISETSSTLKVSRNGLIAPTAMLPALKKKNLLANGHLYGHVLSNGTHLSSPNQLSSMSGGGTWKGIDPDILTCINMQQPAPQLLSPPKYTTLKDVEGHIYGIAKDQHGCRFLQRKFEEGVFEDVQKIFVEIIDHVVELMTDPFGNYLVQKLLEVCNECQRMEILHKVTGKDQLVTISLNMHGTRAVQKLIETLNSAEQVRLVVSSLKQGVVTLIKDLNGNHVVQRCLQRLSKENSQFIFDAAASHCVEIATHRHGCCVLQRCVDSSSGQQRNRLVAEIAANSLVLSQDPFGNYVVQYILDLGFTWAVTEVIAHLDGNYVHLAMQKFSSNVVEKCLKLAGEESKAHIIRELMSTARLAQLLQDPFANYVVQSALMVSKGALHVGLVEAIRPHLPALRSSPYGKRILSRTSLKK